jgi:ABC-type sugar transport system ATPase subunit
VAIILSVDGVCKRYDGIQALRGAHFSLEAGEVHALVGENGAGKSTLARIIASSTTADSGHIVAHGGISMIHQELDLFPHLTVAENVAIGQESGWWVNFDELDGFCRPFLEQVGLAGNTRRLVASLRTGEVQLVAIARALASNAQIILMDEPTSSLTGDSVERLFRLIGNLKQRGVAIVYVSHKMDEIFRISDRVTVLRDGATIGTRVTRETDPNEVIRMMVGRKLETSTSSRVAGGGEIVLSVSRLCTQKLSDVSFDLRNGEVLGIAGLVGAGRSELGAALMGMDRILSGAIQLNGRIGLVPEDRKRDGLMMQMSIVENSSCSVLGRLQRFGFLRTREESRRTGRMFERLNLKAEGAARVSTLSGGNQQKVMLARCLLADPDVLFLDDPTRGIDVGAKQEVYGIIETLKSQGKSLMLVSSELPELLRLSDRIMVMREGRVTAIYEASEATQEKIAEKAV